MSHAAPASLIANGVPVAYRTEGNGPPVLLLHGWGASGKLMWPLAERLVALGYRALALDLPGFGDSPPPPTAWSVADYARTVLAALDGLDVARCLLIGHSFGGRLGLLLGAHHADRVERMVLCNSAGVRPHVALHKRLPTWLFRQVVQRVPPESALGQRLNAVRSRARDRFGSADYRAAGPLRETFLRVVAEDMLPTARLVQVPTLLLWGDQDSDTPLWMGQTLEQAIPDAGLVVFPGAGHYSYLDALPDTVRVMDHFFRQDDSAPPSKADAS